MLIFQCQHLNGFDVRVAKVSNSISIYYKLGARKLSLIKLLFIQLFRPRLVSSYCPYCGFNMQQHEDALRIVKSDRSTLIQT